MNPRWLLRMARWSHRPPSMRRVIMVAAIIVFCLLLYAVERFVGWPDWLSLEPTRGNRMPRF